MEKKHWQGVPYLEVLRPPFGWETELAVLATYSADLVAVTAALLAASGLDDDERKNQSSINFANAYESLRGKFIVLVQSSRISLPPKQSPLLGLLDRLIKQINQNEDLGSWHPKVMVLRFVCKETKEVEWRFWMGSRNLTRDISWDTGLVVSGGIGSRGKQVPGLVESISWLLKKSSGVNATYLKQLQKELKALSWEMPEGIDIEEVRFHGPEEGLGGTFPEMPEKIKELYLISPFLDRKIVERVGTWGGDGTKRTLFSTRPALKKLVALHGGKVSSYDQILWLDEPDLSSELMEEETGTDEVALQSRGLHAKIIMARHASGVTMWLGSANATGRAWRGDIYEVVARIRVAPSVVSGLEAFVGLGRPIDEEELKEPDDTDETEELLESARNQVSARWQVRHTQTEEGNLLYADTPPHPDNQQIMLEVALLSSEYVSWLQGVNAVRLAPVHPRNQTDLLKIRITYGGRHLEWVQLTPQTPGIEEARDRQAIAYQLTPKAFLAWLKAILEEDIPGVMGDSDGVRTPGKGMVSSQPLQVWAPSLESMLKAWGKNPKILESVRDKIDKYLTQVLNSTQLDFSQGDQQTLNDFVETWNVVQKVLVKQ